METNDYLQAAICCIWSNARGDEHCKACPLIGSSDCVNDLEDALRGLIISKIPETRKMFIHDSVLYITDDYALLVVTEQLELSPSIICKKMGIPHTTFYRWLHKRRAVTNCKILIKKMVLYWWEKIGVFASIKFVG